jgi:hypothetical protein
MICIPDFTGSASFLAASFTDSIDLNHEEIPPGFFDPLGLRETYTASVLPDIATLRQESRMEAIPRINAVLTQARSVFEIVELFKRAAQKEKSTKAASIAQQLLPWITLLRDMAYVRSGPNIEERHSMLRIDLSGLPFDFARRWFSVWVHRQYLKGLETRAPRALSKALIIPQGDTLFGKEFSETTGSGTFSLAKRVLALQRFGWAVIVLSEQPSELDQVIRNACIIPICFP